MNRLPATTASWTSSAPVQINVARDLHIHGGGTTSTFDVPDDCEGSHASQGFAVDLRRFLRRSWSAVRLFAAAVWFVVRVIFWAVVGTLVLCVVLPALVLSLGLWLLGRLAALLLVLECKLGGGPTQLAYAPTLRPSRPRGLCGLTAREDAKPLVVPEGAAKDSSSLAVRGYDA